MSKQAITRLANAAKKCRLSTPGSKLRMSTVTKFAEGSKIGSPWQIHELRAGVDNVLNIVKSSNGCRTSDRASQDASC